MAAAAADRPDANLLDVRMPGMDGFEVCRSLKTDPALAAIAVIFLSANVQDDARRQAEQVGAAAYLSKPYDPKAVLGAVASVITAHERNDHASGRTS